MGGILYPKIGGIQGSNQAAPREGKNWGQGTFITTYRSLQIGLVFCSIFFRILGTSVQPHEKLVQAPLFCPPKFFQTCLPLAQPDTPHF